MLRREVEKLWSFACALPYVISRLGRVRVGQRGCFAVEMVYPVFWRLWKCMRVKEGLGGLFMRQC